MIKRFVLPVLIVAALVAPLFLHRTAEAAINPQMSFQGKLTNPDGTNVTDGTYSIRFRIYTDPSADTGSCANTCKWEETQGSASVSGGLFRVNLGSVTGLPGSVDFNSSALYLGVKVGSDAEMTPRVRLTAAPYAFNSDTLDGLDSAALGQLAAGQTWSGANIFQPTANSTALTVKQTSTGSPTADIFNVQTANSTNVIQVTGPAANEAAVTIASIGATRALTLSSGSGTIVLGASSLQRTASGTTSINLVDGANTLLNVTNSGAGTASINTDGGYQINGTPGASVTCSGGQFLQNQVVSGGLVTGGTCIASSGSPGGSDTHIQFNNSSAFGGEADFLWNQTTNTLTLGGVDTGLVLQGVTNEPASPASGTLRAYSKDIAGRMMLKWKGPSGLDQVVQPGMFFSAVRMVIPNGNNSVTTWGVSNTVVGTLTAPTIAATNLKTSVNRVRVVSATTANSASEMRTAGAQVWRGNAAGLGGFFYSATFSVNSTTTNQRLFVGLMNATGATATTSAPSALTNILGVGWDSADTTLQIMHNDASGTATKVNLGANFPSNTTAAVYEVTLFSAANGSTISYRVKRLDTEQTASGTISTDMPANTSFLCRHEYMNNGGTAAAVDLEIMRVYLESDY